VVLKQVVDISVHLTSLPKSSNGSILCQSCNHYLGVNSIAVSCESMQAELAYPEVDRGADLVMVSQNFGRLRMLLCHADRDCLAAQCSGCDTCKAIRCVYPFAATLGLYVSSFVTCY
jgi:hypothetical protein